MRVSELFNIITESTDIVENRLAKLVSRVQPDSFRYIILDGGEGKGVFIVRNQKNRFFGIESSVNENGSKITTDLKFKSLGDVTAKVKDFQNKGYTKLERHTEISRFMLIFLKNLNQLVVGFGGNKIRLITIPALLYVATLFRPVQTIITPHLGGGAAKDLADKNRELYIKRSGFWLDIIDDVKTDS